MKVTALKCFNCGDTIYSRTRHDFRYCTCKDVAIDGGLEYTKVSFNEKAKYEFVELEIDATKESLHKDWNLNKNKLGLIRGKKKKK